jgi:hypothetical protein
LPSLRCGYSFIEQNEGWSEAQKNLEICTALFQLRT